MKFATLLDAFSLKGNAACISSWKALKADGFTIKILVNMWSWLHSDPGYFKLVHIKIIQFVVTLGLWCLLMAVFFYQLLF